MKKFYSGFLTLAKFRSKRPSTQYITSFTNTAWSTRVLFFASKKVWQFRLPHSWTSRSICQGRREKNQFPDLSPLVCVCCFPPRSLRKTRRGREGKKPFSPETNFRLCGPFSKKPPLLTAAKKCTEDFSPPLRKERIYIVLLSSEQKKRKTYHRSCGLCFPPLYSISPTLVIWAPR